MYLHQWYHSDGVTQCVQKEVEAYLTSLNLKTRVIRSKQRFRLVSDGNLGTFL